MAISPGPRALFRALPSAVLGLLSACIDSGGELSTASDTTAGSTSAADTTAVTTGSSGETPTTGDTASTADASSTGASDTGASDTGDSDTGQADFWLPAPGGITNINQNSASDVDIDPGVAAPGKWYNGFLGGNSFGGMVGSWNGGIWAREYSTDGALVFFGGGHGANIGCFSYFFDVTSRQWKQVGAERNLPPEDDWSGGYPFGSVPDKRDPVWLDYDYNGGKIVVLGHQYSSVNYLTPAEGGAPGTGSLLLANAEGDQTAGMATRWGAWTFSMSDGLMQRSLAGEPIDGTSSGSLISVKDSVNDRLWYFKQGYSQVFYHDLTAPLPRPLLTTAIGVEPGAPNGGYTIVYDAAWLFVPEAKAVVILQGTGEVGSGMVATLVDFSSGAPVMAAAVVPPHPGGEAGFAHGGLNIAADWDSKRKRVVMYEGLGDDFTHVLTPSSLDFKTATWTWSREAYTGRAPANSHGDVGAATSLESPWDRWHYVETLDVFVWTDGPSEPVECEDGVVRDGVVQFWHPTGTPI